MDPGRLHRAGGGDWLEASPLRQRSDAGLRFGSARRAGKDHAEGPIEERRVVDGWSGGGDPGRDPGSGIVDESGIGKRQRLLRHDAPLALVAFLDASAVESEACVAALAQWRSLEPVAADGAVEPARIHLVWARLNHTDFVTLR